MLNKLYLRNVQKIIGQLVDFNFSRTWSARSLTASVTYQAKGQSLLHVDWIHRSVRSSLCNYAPLQLNPQSIPFFSIFTHSTHHNSHYFVATHTTIFTWGKVPSNLFHFRINIESYACLFDISRLCCCFRRICHLFLWLCNVLQELDVTNFRGIFHIGKNTNLPFDITFHFPFCPL